MRILYTNLADTGTLTASTENTDFPKENIQHPFKAKQYKATALTDEFLKWDLGSAKSITSMALINHNLDAGGTYNFQMHSADTWGTPDVDETITHNSGMMIKYFTGGSKQWVRLRMQSMAANPAIGRVFFGVNLNPTKNYLVNWVDSLVDISKESATIEGLIHTDVNSQFRQIQLNIANMSLTDKNNFLTFLAAVGLSKYFVISLDETNYPNARSFYGKLNSMPVFSHSITELYDASISFSEQPS